MYDIIIKNGKLIDGTGCPAFDSDLAIKDGKIACIAENLTGGKKIIDARGLVVTPGFIDSHSHSDSTVLTFPGQAEKAEQGITTSIGGNCGSTNWPALKNGEVVLASTMLDQAAQVPQGSNLATFVGHRALRRVVMGMEKRSATQGELEKMGRLLREGIQAGALGISFGLIYTPSCYARTEELIYLAKVAKECGGMLSAHIRSEADDLVAAVSEMITVAKAADVRTVFSHHKAMFRQNHGKVNTTLALIRQAIREGADLYCDVYPYIASSTSLATRFIPDKYVNDQLPEYMKDIRLRSELKTKNLEKWGEDLSWVPINTCAYDPAFSGLTLTEAAQLHSKDVYETLFDILQAQPQCQASFLSMCEADVETVMAYERTMICTDSAVAGDKTDYHPRLRGSFPRVLGRYVRQRNVVSLPEMIRKMTSLPASVYGLQRKGLLAPGYDADICIFDPDTIIDRADFKDCTKRAEGLFYVFVSGQLVAENAIYNGATPGKLILRKNEVS